MMASRPLDIACCCPFRWLARVQRARWRVQFQKFGSVDGVIAGLYKGHIGDILGIYWGYSGVILGLYQDMQRAQIDASPTKDP